MPKKQYEIILASVLAASLLAGCAEQEAGYVPGSESNFTSEADSGNLPDSLSTGNASTSGSTSTSQSSTESEKNTESSSYVWINYPESTSSHSLVVSPDAVPVEFTEEDRELQKILEELDKGESCINVWFTCGAPLVNNQHDFEYRFIFPEIDRGDDKPLEIVYYQIPDGYSEAGAVIPHTCEEMKEFILDFLAEDEAEWILPRIGKGSFTENSDGTYSVVLEDDKAEWGPEFLEIDGSMYRNCGVGGRGPVDNIFASSEKVTLWTDDTIEFTYLPFSLSKHEDNIDEDGNLKQLKDVSLYNDYARNGVLRYERGGWKRGYKAGE